MITARTIAGSLSAVALLACGDNTPMPPPVSGDLRLVPVASGLASPLYLTAPPGDVQRRRFSTSPTAWSRGARKGS